MRLFVDAHQTKWQGDPNYAHWQAGPVIDDVAGLGEALAETRRDFETVYRPIQQRLFAHSFDLTDEPSAVRAARAIATIAGLTS